MKHYYLVLLFLFSFCLGFAQTQDSLSLEEQQRREKNIQAGNPFKKFGYKPKISTLSKGKYLEFHDLDSIVQIGSFTFHVKKKIVTGYIVKETKYSEATLRPEIVSRWFSPDPLSDEFPSWSPYVFTNDNPIFFTDPTGLAPMSPIYNTNGDFLGTDDQGLQGKAIVMEESDFTQGMSHQEALTSSLGAEGLTSNQAISKLAANYNGLKSRPDYNGQMSYSELVSWGKENGNSPVYLDASKIDLGSISTNDFPGVGAGVRINTVGRGTPLDTYGPWGKNFMTLTSSSGTVRLSPDEFDYRQHSLRDAWDEGAKVFMYETFIRYPSIKALQIYHGIDNNFGFMMYPYGSGKLNDPKLKDTFIRFGE